MEFPHDLALFRAIDGHLRRTRKHRVLEAMEDLRCFRPLGELPDLEPFKRSRVPDILFIDDEVLIAVWAQSVLEDDGYEVAIAHDGVQGLAAYITCPARLIITDLAMPKLDGLTMIAALTQQGFVVPVVVASAWADDTLMSRRNAAVRAILIKPYTEAQLLNTVRQLLPVGTPERRDG